MPSHTHATPNWKSKQLRISGPTCFPSAYPPVTCFYSLHEALGHCWWQDDYGLENTYSSIQFYTMTATPPFRKANPPMSPMYIRPNWDIRRGGAADSPYSTINSYPRCRSNNQTLACTTLEQVTQRGDSPRRTICPPGALGTQPRPPQVLLHTAASPNIGGAG